MSLFVPGFLAFLTLPIIVLLHLIRRRRKQQRLPSLRLWQALQAPVETRSRFLPLTWLLILHLMIALFLAIALLRPLTTTLTNDAPQHTTLIIDITSSMGATDEQPSRLAQAQQLAFGYIDQLQGLDSLTIVTLEPLPELVSSGQQTDRDRLRTTVASLSAAGNGGDLRRALALANATLEQDKRNTIVILSDLALPEPPQPLEAQAPVLWNSVGGPTPNLAVVALEARRLPTQDIAVYTRIASYTEASRNQQVQLFVDDQPFAQDSISIPANGTQELVWTIPAGSERVAVSVDVADGLAADNQARLPLQTIRNLKIRLITDSPDSTTALERVLGSLPGLNVTVAQQDNPADPVDVTVLDGILPATLPNGALLVVNPPLNDSRLVMSSIITRSFAMRGTLDDAFINVDLSSVNWFARYVVNRQELPASLQPIIRDTTDNPLVLRGTLDGHASVIWAFDISQSNLPAKLAFPLLSAASINVLTGGGLPATITPGSRLHTTTLRDPNGDPLTERLDLPGWYSLTDDSGTLAVNFGDRQESQLSPGTQPVITPIPLDQTLGVQTPPRNEHWRIFVGLALLTLLIEWWYVFRYRQTTPTTVAG